MTTFMTKAEARAISDQWKDLTEPELGYDEKCSMRISSAAALLPIARQVPNDWLGGSHEKVYSALIIGTALDDRWFVFLGAGEDRDDVQAFINRYTRIYIGGTA